MTNPSDTELRDKFNELIFLKLGLDLTREDAQYPLVPAADLKKFHKSVLELFDSCRAKERAEILALIPDNRELYEPVTQRMVASGDKVGIDLEVDPRGSLKFVQDNGYNQALNQVRSAIEKRGL